MKLIWSRRSQADLVSLVRYIALDDVGAALRMYEHIELSIEAVVAMPLRGRIGRTPGTRELVITGSPYIVVYQVTGDQVEVARIIHGAQDWPPREN